MKIKIYLLEKEDVVKGICETTDMDVMWTLKQQLDVFDMIAKYMPEILKEFARQSKNNSLASKN